MSATSPSPPPEDESAASGPRPRRRREQSEASAFLSKTYAMIDALPSSVGGWSESGDSMVIFDAETFASQIIPQYFKHNNFRSFVRQLNFYGFRKLRADAGNQNANRWEFKHGNFRRGRPELLVQIRRAEHYDYSAPDAAAQKQRQTETERDVADLRQKVADLQQQVDELRDLTQKLQESLASQAVSLSSPPSSSSFNAAKTTNKDHSSSSSKKQSKRKSPSSGSTSSAAASPSAKAGADLPQPPLVGKDGATLTSLPSLGAPPPLSPGSLDVLAGVGAPSVYSQALEGQPLNKRMRNGGDLLEGQPLERRLSTFETSRLDSLIRTLDDDSEEQIPTDVFGSHHHHHHHHQGPGAGVVGHTIDEDDVLPPIDDIIVPATRGGPSSSLSSSQQQQGTVIITKKKDPAAADAPLPVNAPPATAAS